MIRSGRNLWFAIGLAIGLWAGALPVLAQAPPAVAALKLDKTAAAAREKGLRALADGIDDAAESFFRDYRDAVRQQEPALTDATILLVQTCLRTRNLTAAEEAFRFQREQSPGLSDFSRLDALGYWRSALLLNQGKWADAESELRPLVQRAKTPAYRKLALEALADACARQGHWTDAETAFTRLQQEFPDKDTSLRARLGVVKIALAAGQAERAAPLLDQLDKQYGPDPLPVTGIYRVLLLLATDKWQEALALYRQAEPRFPVRPGPDHWLVASRLAAALAEHRQFTDAYKLLERSLGWASTQTDRIQTRLRMCECLIATEQVESAITALENFRKEFPGVPELVTVDLKLAELLRQSKSFLTACDYYGNVVDSPGAASDLRYQAAHSRAVCFREAGQLANASQAFSKAAKLGLTPEQQAQCLFLAGDAAFALGTFTNAALLYQSVADTFPALPMAEKARFNQGLSRAREGQFSQAAMILKTFLDTYPTSVLADQARIERGVALRSSGDAADAVKELEALVAANPENPLAPQALLEAHLAALGMGNPAHAIELLTRLATGYASSPLVPTAYYRRAHLQFLAGDYRAALADCEYFAGNFSASPLLGDVLMWLGDYYVSTKAAEQGEGYYLQVATRLPSSPLAPEALIEAAKSAFQRGDTSRALSLSGQLFRDYSTTVPPAMLARAEMLQGDLLSSQGQYQDAIPHFTRIRDLVPDTDLANAASGRLGDMYYSLGDDNADNLGKAQEVFARLAADDKAAPAEREKTRFRLGKTLEKLNQPDKAIKEYLEIVYQWDVDAKAGKPRDWFYFLRAGSDAARLLLIQERYLEAARLYERLAASKLPGSEDAGLKAREIRKTYKLLN